jgi:hypothetical protein
MGYLDTLYKGCLRRLQKEEDMKKVHAALDILATSATGVYDSGQRHDTKITEEAGKQLSRLDIPILNTMRKRIAASGIDEESIRLTGNSEWPMYFVEHLNRMYTRGQKHDTEDIQTMPLFPKPPAKEERCRL